MRARIYLKSGATVEIEVDEINTKCINGELTTMNWAFAGKNKRLQYVRLDDVSAVVVDRG